MAISAGPLVILPSMGDTIFRARRAEAQPFNCPGPIQLTPRFTTLKQNLVAGKESAIDGSFQRLLRELPREIDRISALGSQAIPAISFSDTTKPQLTEGFLRDLRQRGVGIIRGVIPRDTALTWSRETQEFDSQNRQARSGQPENVFWSPAQIKARAHPNVLAAQRFIMSIWTSSDPRARVTSEFPISYADRMGVHPAGGLKDGPYAHVDGGSVERWEPDGYGRAGTYGKIIQGRWEEYDPWESSTRLAVTSDLYHKASACSIYRMFQGWLALNPIPPGPGSVQVCPLPRLATAYFLLRPFFSPSAPHSNQRQDQKEEKWTLTTPQNSILHGALPSYAQEISPSLHPHLDLARSLVPAPHLEPGDYLVWHPDLIHRITDPDPMVAVCKNTATNEPGQEYGYGYRYMYLPACPLTQTNALYLSRQRKAFLAGLPGPDFSVVGGGGGGGGGGVNHARGGGSISNAGGAEGYSRYRAQSENAHQSGVQDIRDAGGDEGLRAMGLLPWDEEEADEDATREVLAMANGILFPEMFDML